MADTLKLGGATDDTIDINYLKSIPPERLQFIQQYLTQHPGASTQEVVEAYENRSAPTDNVPVTQNAPISDSPPIEVSDGIGAVLSGYSSTMAKFLENPAIGIDLKSQAILHVQYGLPALVTDLPAAAGSLIGLFQVLNDSSKGDDQATFHDGFGVLGGIAGGEVGVAFASLVGLGALTTGGLAILGVAAGTYLAYKAADGLWNMSKDTSLAVGDYLNALSLTLNQDGSMSMQYTNGDGSSGFASNDGHGNGQLLINSTDGSSSGYWTKNDGSSGVTITDASGNNLAIQTNADQSIHSTYSNTDGTSGSENISTNPITNITTDDAQVFNSGVLQSEKVTTTSSNGDQTIVNMDGNGVVTQTESITTDQATNVTTADVKNMNPDGTVESEVIATTASNGDQNIVSMDGNGVVTQTETIVTDPTTNVTTADLKTLNPDGTLQGEAIATTAQNGDQTVVSTDGNGFVTQTESITTDPISDITVDSLTAFNADGTSTSYVSNSLGNTTINDFAADGTRTADTWMHADGSSGDDTYNSDGSSSGTIANADGTSGSYSNDGQGNITTNHYDVAGELTNYSVSQNDGQGNITTDNYDATGILVSYSVSQDDGQGSITTNNYDVSGQLTSYDVSQDNGQGDVTTKNFNVDGIETGDSWTHADGSSGSDTYNLDGSSSGTVHNVDGTFSAYANDGEGNVTTKNFSVDGVETGDSWTRADGSGGSDTYNTDGSSSGIAHNLDGTSSSYANDGYGNVTTTDFAVNGTKIGDAWTDANGSNGNDIYNPNGSSSGAVYNADGSSSGYANDVQGNSTVTVVSAGGNTVDVVHQNADGQTDWTSNTTTDAGLQTTTTNNYDTQTGLKTSDSWMRSDGTTGTDTFNTENGSSSGTLTQADGTYSTYTDDGQGSIARTDYSKDGVVIGDSWVRADGSTGTDIFDAVDGSSSGTSVNPDGSYVEYVADGQGNITRTMTSADGKTVYVTHQNAGGKTDWTSNSVADSDGGKTTTITNYDPQTGSKTSDSWTRSDGTSGTDAFNANGSSSGTLTQADGTYSTYTDDGQGNIARMDYAQDGVKIGDSWVHSDGSVGTDTFSANGSSSGTVLNVDGTSKDYINDGHGNITTTGYTTDEELAYTEVVKTTSAGTSVTISGDGDNASFDNANITINAGSNATVVGDGNKVNVGKDAAAILIGKKEQVAAADGATVDVSNSSVQSDSAITVIGSNDIVFFDSGNVQGNSNVIYGSDGGDYYVAGNGNALSAGDNAHVDINGDGNTITTGEISTDQVSGQNNTLQMWGGGYVTIDANSMANIEDSYKVVVANSSFDADGDETTTYWEVPEVNGNHDYKPSDGSFIGQSFDDVSNDTVTTDMYFSGGEVSEHEVVTSLDDGNQVDDITEYSLNGNRVEQYIVTSGEEGDISYEQISYSNNQISSDQKTSYSDDVTTTAQFDSAGNLESTAIYEISAGQISITYLDADGVKTEDENFFQDSAGGYDDERNFFNSEGQQTAQSMLNYLGDVTQSTQFEDGVKTETDILNAWGGLSEVDHFNNLGQETEKDLYEGDAVSESDIFNSDGQQIEKNLFNSDGQLTQQDQYDDQGNLTSSSNLDDPGSGGDGGGGMGGGTGGDLPPIEEPPTEEPPFDPFEGGGDGFGFAGDKTKIDKVINGDVNVIAQYDLSHGDTAGAVAAETAMQQAQQMVALSSTPGTHAAVLEGAKWDSNVITWSLTTDSSIAGVPVNGDIGSSEEQAAQAAFATWASASGLTFKEVTDSSQSDIRIGLSDFDTADTDVIGYTTTHGQDGQFASGTVVRIEDPTEATLVTGADGQQTYAGTDATLSQVLLHEIGHALGLGEDADLQSIMSYELTAGNRTLDATDIAGIQSLYGSGALPAANVSVDQLVQAMASFAPESAAHSNTPAANDPLVNPPLLAASH